MHHVFIQGAPNLHGVFFYFHFDLESWMGECRRDYGKLSSGRSEPHFRGPSSWIGWYGERGESEIVDEIYARSKDSEDHNEVQSCRKVRRE